MKQPRNGYSLIEMLAVISVLSVMVALATVTIALLIRSERAGGESVVAAQAAHRLARQFRDDVHAAHDATISFKAPGQPALSLETRGRPTVTWSRVPAGLRRTVNTKPVQIETYRVPVSDVSFALSPNPDASSQQRLVSLTTVPRTQNRRRVGDTWPVRVAAALGREATP